MKKNLLFSLVIPIFFIGCASIGSPVGYTVRGSGGAVFLGNVLNELTGRNFGPKTGIIIANTTQIYYFEVVILDKKFYIEPSGSIYDSWVVEWNNSQLPVTIRVFTDSTFKNFVGIANKVLCFGVARPELWSVGVKDIHFIDGNRHYYGYSQISPYPQPDIGKDWGVNIPTIPNKGTNIAEIINATMFEIVIRGDEARGKISGSDEIVASGGIYRSTTFAMYDRGVIVRYAMVVDRGRFVGYAGPFRFDVNPNGPRAKQYLVTPNMIRRY